MLLDASQSQLVLVDYQQRLMPAIFESQAVLANAVRLGRMAGLLELPVWGTEENPSKLGENVAELRALCQRTLPKMHFSAVEEGLADWLRALPWGALAGVRSQSLRPSSTALKCILGKVRWHRERSSATFWPSFEGFSSVPQTGTSSRRAMRPSRTAFASTASASKMAGIRRCW